MRTKVWSSLFPHHSQVDEILHTESLFNVSEVNKYRSRASLFDANEHDLEHPAQPKEFPLDEPDDFHESTAELEGTDHH